MASSSVVRTYDEEREYIKQISPCAFTIDKGFVDNMRVSIVRAGHGSHTNLPRFLESFMSTIN